MPTPSDLREQIVVEMENEGVVTWGDPRHRARFLAAQPSGLRSDDPETPAFPYAIEYDDRDHWITVSDPGGASQIVAQNVSLGQFRSLIDAIAANVAAERAAIGEGSSGSTLDAAWAAAEAALPEGWAITGLTLRAAVMAGRYWLVIANRPNTRGIGASARGDTPAAALQALAARLRVPVAGDRE